MTIPAHALSLGRLLLNLHSLEITLRLCLGKFPLATPYGLPHGQSVYDFAVGASVPLNDFTDYSTLKELIARYNKAVGQHSIGRPIDATLVDLRDAMAHGRVSAEAENVPLRLIKFSKSSAGQTQVTVTVNLTMDEQWFDDENRRVTSALMEVYNTVGLLDPASRP